MFNALPTTGTYASTETLYPSVFFSSTSTPDFNGGSASTLNWQIGQSGRVVNYRTLCNTNATSPSFFVKYRGEGTNLTIAIGFVILRIEIIFMPQNPESIQKLNIKKALRAAAATAFISTSVIAPMAHAEDTTQETFSQTVHTDRPTLPNKMVLPGIASDRISPETKPLLKGFSFLEQGLEIADSEPYTKLQVSNFSKKDTEIFNQSYEEIKGKNSQAPEIKDNEMAFIVAVSSIQGPALKLKGLEQEDTEKLTINIEFSSPSDTIDYESAGRENYIIGIVDKKADIAIYYPKADEPFLTLPKK